MKYTNIILTMIFGILLIDMVNFNNLKFIIKLND